MGLRALVAIVLLAASAAAQTYVVDANNGPGTNFLDIATAVAAVPDGATLLVRAGSYGGFTVDGKGIAIRGGANVVISGLVTVRNTQASQEVELRGLGWTVPSSWTTSILVCDTCLGPLWLAGLTVPGVPSCVQTQPFCPRDPAVLVTACQQVLLSGSRVSGNVALRMSNAVLDACILYGEPVIVNGNGPFTIISLARSALSVSGGSVQSTSSVFGGQSESLGHGQWSTGATAIELMGGDLRLLRGPVGAFSVLPPLPPAITATGGVLRADPSVSISSQVSPPVQGITVTVLGMPAITTTDGTVGGAISASATAPSGDVVVLLVGFPGPTVHVGGIQDGFWLQPAAYYFAAFGVPMSGQPLAGTLPVPNVPLLVGTHIAWQAVSGSATTGALQSSNPGVSTVL